jgi:tRNA modification GTPase
VEGSATIFSVASGAGRAAVAVVRISGARAGAAVAHLAGRIPSPRRATLRVLRAGDEMLDHALVLWFPAPASYTGEDCAELQLHGGVAVVEGVADALVAFGLRPAEAGEFTRRAFLNGRLGLTEAEAVADLVAAETAAQRQQALLQMQGALGQLYNSWADRLLRLMAQQEALIDFPEDGLPSELEQAGGVEMAALQREIARHLNDDRRGERLRDGITIVVLGPPNVGKSSLVNALSGRDVAIVAPTPGTTRDALETRVIWGGVPVTLVDTAGLRDTADSIEAEGVRRARQRAREADLIVAVHEAGSSADRSPLTDHACAVVQVASKSDLVADLSLSAHGAILVSTRTGHGLPTLREHLQIEIRRLTQRSGAPPLTRARHRSALNDSLAHLEAAGQARLPELRGEDLRLALRAIGRITGAIATEDLLDVIFRDFCIGK